MRSAVRTFAAALLAAWFMPAAAQSLERPLILAASPGAGAQTVGSIVLLVAPVGGDKHIGFIVNRPSEVPLGKLFPNLPASQETGEPLYIGGPLEMEVVFALVQRPLSPGGNSLQVMPGLYAAYEPAVVDRIIDSDPQHARFFAGFMAWRPGELQDEVDAGAWIVLEADANVVMGEPERLWEELVQRWQHHSQSI